MPDTQTLAARHARLDEVRAAAGVEVLVLSNPVSLRYLTNHAGSAGLLVAGPGGLSLIVDFRYRESLRQLQAGPCACPALTVVDVPTTYEAALLECLARLGVQRAGIEAGHVTVSRLATWERLAGEQGRGLVFTPLERVVERLRLVKDAVEQASLREAAARLTGVTDALFDGVVRSGRTERAVATDLERLMREAGYERLAFDTIVASGPNGALPHYRAGDRVLARGDLVVLDFGGVLDGYCCDLTRTVAIGTPGSQARDLHAAVLEAQRAAVDAVRPGLAASDVDAAARRVLERHGLGEAFGHGTGHGLGLDVHEEPAVSPRRGAVSPAELTTGMVFTVEPGAYLPGFGGVRIEDDVLVTPGGCEVLTHVPRELLTFD